MLLDISFSNKYFLNKQSRAVNHDMKIFKCICMGNMFHYPIIYLSLISGIMTVL